MKIIQKYEQEILEGKILNEPSQREVIEHLRRLRLELTKKYWFWPPKIKGIYLYGAVGCGKSYLLNLFFETVELLNKKRFHFHHFMQEIDASLRKFQGSKNPLDKVAKNFAGKYRLIYLDEFMVRDIVVAMMLKKLLRAFAKHRVVFVFSSNIAPDDLYRNGLQRNNFLAAIEIIKLENKILHLEIQRDFRKLNLELLPTYLFPCNQTNLQAFRDEFNLIAPHTLLDSEITIQDRSIKIVKHEPKNAVWFEFAAICTSPRSQLDYLEIAQNYKIIFISDVPQLADSKNIIFLINFIDVMYDATLKVFINAAVPLEELYIAKNKILAYERTLSRLYEMQTKKYAKKFLEKL